MREIRCRLRPGRAGRSLRDTGAIVLDARPHRGHLGDGALTRPFGLELCKSCGVVALLFREGEQRTCERSAPVCTRCDRLDVAHQRSRVGYCAAVNLARTRAQREAASREVEWLRDG